MNLSAGITNEFIKKLVINGELPRYLFKYKSLALEHTFDIFRHSKLYFPPPSSFNDPFDCKISADTDCTDSDLENWMRQAYPDRSRRQQKEHLKIYLKLKNKSPGQFRSIVNKRIDQTRHDSGIFCCAGCNDDILMWSHYGDSHRGICIKFDVLADPGLFVTPLTVLYASEYPSYKYFRDHNAFFKVLFQTKSEQWSYEKEIRIFKERFGNYKFRPLAIVEICAGCNASSELISKLKMVIAENGFDHILWKQAKVSKASFGLEICPG